MKRPGNQLAKKGVPISNCFDGTGNDPEDAARKEAFIGGGLGKRNLLLDIDIHCMVISGMAIPDNAGEYQPTAQYRQKGSRYEI